MICHICIHREEFYAMDKFTSRKILNAAAYILYAIFAVLYFIPAFGLPHKICIPVFILAALSAGKAPWQITAALVFSALGDLAGSFKASTGSDLAMVFQILFFALGHIFYIINFCVTAFRHKRNQDMAAKKSGLYIFAVLLVCAGIFCVTLNCIVPCVDIKLLKICVACYAAIIMTMLFSALMTRDWIIGLGAVLFVTSDFILAWNMFVGEIPGENYLTMVSYYAAQAIIASRIMFNQRICTKQCQNTE